MEKCMPIKKRINPDIVNGVAAENIPLERGTLKLPSREGIKGSVQSCSDYENPEFSGVNVRV